MAFEKGRQARRDGVSKSANPYPNGPSRAMWDDGWVTTDTILRALGLP